MYGCRHCDKPVHLVISWEVDNIPEQKIIFHSYKCDNGHYFEERIASTSGNLISILDAKDYSNNVR